MALALTSVSRAILYRKICPSPASATSFWKMINLPGLNDNNGASKIWNMADNTVDPGKHDKDVKHTAFGLAYLPCQLRRAW